MTVLKSEKEANFSLYKLGFTAEQLVAKDIAPNNLPSPDVPRRDKPILEQLVNKIKALKPADQSQEPSDGPSERPPANGGRAHEGRNDSERDDGSQARPNAPEVDHGDPQRSMPRDQV